jgi:hypothetical protein
MQSKPGSAKSRWEYLEANAHLPEVQAIIRREIFRGTIRVAPTPSGAIRIVPLDGSAIEESQVAPHAGPGQSSRRESPLRIGRAVS